MQDNINEGPLDFTKGVVGALRAKSDNTKTAKAGRAQLRKAGGNIAAEKKMKAMSAQMYKKWRAQVDELTKAGKSSNGKAFNSWMADFMAPREVEPFTGPIGPGDVEDYIDTMVATYYGKKIEPGSRKATAQASAEPKKTGPDYSANDQDVLTKHLDKKDNRRSDAGLDGQAMKASGTDAGLKNARLKTKIRSLQQRAKASESNPFMKGKIEDKITQLKASLTAESLATSLMNDYLKEGILFETKNTHLEHIEDLVFNHGYKGAEQALDFISQTIAMLATGSGEVEKLSVKWDGSPGIFCGIDPEDGRFFVGTKSVFNKEPRLAKDQKSLLKYYGDKPGLYEKLAIALKYLPKLGIGNILQGDMMFTSGDLESDTIDGEEMVVFTPNTITYATKANGDLGKKIKKAKIGVVFHTSYSGSSMADMVASFGPNTSGLNRTSDVWFDDAIFKDMTGVASFTPEELSKVKSLTKAINSTLSKVRADKFDIVMKNKEFSRFVKPFINQMVRDGNVVSDPMTFLKGFLEFYRGKMQKEMDKISAEKGPDNVGITNRLAKIKKKEEFLEDNSNALLGVLAVYKRLVQIKLLIIKKMQQVDGLGTFIKDGNEYKVTNPEGFVAVGRDGGAIKLVNRLEFSQNNFNAVKNWK